MLPIEPILPAIRDGLAGHRSIVVQAPPGAGKTTHVPLALLDAEWLGSQCIVMLEPRRLATRAAAHRLAELHGTRVGDVVGYRMRGDSRVSSATRIEVVTEGILTRRLQRDPTLDGVGVLIFDEFHERSLDADLGLALALRTQSLVRDDLRIVVMSATLDGERVASLLGNVPIITSEGRAFPVETRYRAPRAEMRTEGAAVAVIVEALRDEPGDVLVFLPGAAEINRASTMLEERAPSGVVIAPLFGALAQGDQARAILPDPRGRRRVVLSTSIAETSLTIEGIRVVIDSGLSRRPRFSPATGMSRLETVRASRASADQRRGRAGRLEPGVCYRLWAEHETHALLADSPPEILTGDLAPLALDLAAAGVADPRELAWLDLPPGAAYANAHELLRELGALDEHGRITQHGRAMSELPAHPRLAHMLVESTRIGALPTAAAIAALLGERDVLRRGAAPLDADIGLRLDLVTREERAPIPAGAEVDRDVLRRVRDESRRLMQLVGGNNRAGDSRIGGQTTVSVGGLLALAYPDRIAQRRAGDRARFLLRHGRGGELIGAQTLSESAFIVAAELDDRRPDSRIFLGAAISVEEIREEFADQIVREDLIELDEDSGSIMARRRESLGAIILRETSGGEISAEKVREVLLAAIRSRGGVSSLPWSENAQRTRARLAFVAAHDSSWPSVADDALDASLDEWLAPHLEGVRRWTDLARVDLASALVERLDWRQRRELDALAPTHIEVPTGSKIALDYSDPRSPVLAVRIQEMFGLTDTPRIMNASAPVTIHLLSPAYRPVQVTQDLAGFWRTSYFDVRKDLRGRYPKHEWPEDPLTAAPTRRAKPRK